MSIFLIAASFTIIFINLVLLWKVRKIHLHLYSLERFIDKNKNTLFAQVEALLGLYHDLKFLKGLPKTRNWAGSPDFLFFIAKVAQSKSPTVIIECSSGVSTVVLAQCCKLNGQGHVYSLEHESVFAEQTRVELSRHQLNDWATIIDAPLRKHYISGQEWLWYSLDNLPDSLSVDMIVIDGPPSCIQRLARYPAGPMLFEMLKKSGSIILDDTLREDEQKIVEMWKKEFHQFNRIDVDCEKGCILLTYSEDNHV